MRNINQIQRPSTDLRMETEVEADPMLKLSERKASPFQIWIIGLVRMSTGVVVCAVS